MRLNGYYFLFVFLGGEVVVENMEFCGVSFQGLRFLNLVYFVGAPFSLTVSEV